EYRLATESARRACSTWSQSLSLQPGTGRSRGDTVAIFQTTLRRKGLENRSTPLHSVLRVLRSCGIDNGGRRPAELPLASRYAIVERVQTSDISPPGLATQARAISQPGGAPRSTWGPDLELLSPDRKFRGSKRRVFRSFCAASSAGSGPTSRIVRR